MNFIIRLLEKLRNKDYREGYTEAQFSVRLPFQIRALREKHGWTQAELAKRMGTSRSQISQIEQVGIGPRSLKMLYKLCAAFDISLLIQFVSFRDLVKHIEKFDIETFNAKSFSEDQQAEEYMESLVTNTKFGQKRGENLITQRLDFSTTECPVEIYHCRFAQTDKPDMREFRHIGVIDLGTLAQ